MSKVIYWLPRIMGILIICILLFFIYLLNISRSVIGPNITTPTTKIIIGRILSDSIPVFILLGLLIIAWKYELIGVITFGFLGIYAYVLLIQLNMSYALFAMIFLFIIAGLFFLSRKQSKK